MMEHPFGDVVSQINMGDFLSLNSVRNHSLLEAFSLPRLGWLVCLSCLELPGLVKLTGLADAGEPWDCVPGPSKSSNVGNMEYYYNCK